MKDHELTFYAQSNFDAHTLSRSHDPSRTWVTAADVELVLGIASGTASPDPAFVPTEKDSNDENVNADTTENAHCCFGRNACCISCHLRLLLLQIANKPRILEYLSMHMRRAMHMRTVQ